jgi:PPOX class probable F420-dependent enzyme
VTDGDDRAVAGSGAGEWLARVAAAPVGRLATHRADGGIDLVPFVFVWLPDPPPLGRLVSAVDHKPKRHERLQRLANVAAHPGVTVLVDHYEEDWSALWWVRLRGEARELAPGGDDTALSALVAKYRAYRERPPAGALLRVELTAVQGWSAS